MTNALCYSIMSWNPRISWVISITTSKAIVFTEPNVVLSEIPKSSVKPIARYIKYLKFN